MLDGVRSGTATLVGLLVLMTLAPLAMAEPAQNGLELLVEIDAPEHGEIFSDAEDISVTLRVKNHATEARQLTYNPACPYDLSLTNGAWELDIDETRTCPDQSRAMTIQPGQTRILSTMTWDWSDAPSGPITLEFEQPDAGLSASDVVMFHRTVVIPANLQLQAVLAETVGEQPGHSSEMPAMVLLSLANTGESTIDLPFDSFCRVAATDLACGEGSLAPATSRALGWAVWELDSSIEGEQAHTFTLTAVEGAAATVSTSFTRTSTSDSSALIPAAMIDADLNWRFLVTNSDDVPAKMLFEDACLVQMHIVAPTGEIVYDTRTESDCPEIGTEIRLDPQETFTLAGDAWDGLDENGCEIEDGLHLMVLNQPDHRLIASQAFEHTNSGTDPACRAANGDISDIRFAVEDLQVLDADGASERISLHMGLANLGSDSVEVYWPTDCALEFTLGRIGESPLRTWTDDCEGGGGQMMDIPSMASHDWPTFEIPFITDGEPVANGTYLLSIRTTSIPAFTAQAAHTYDGPHTAAPETPVEEVEPVVEVVEEIIEIDSTEILSGDWYHVTEAHQGCWILIDSSGHERSLVAHMQNGRWMPSPGLSGTYLTEESPASGDCAKWSGFVILETLDETETAPASVVVEAPIVPVQTPVEGVLQYTPTAAAVVASTSISVLVLMYVGNTEWIRIPALQFGLGLVGMVRRRREHDGEYQRGRIMGYLTANPGVHFRALLGALEMSNGQLTHHLKHLQGEERIWRRKDGRLVRFYPASIQATQNEDELPVPLLTPDPNSLQGKILRLLDATENDIINLSQKELSVRLEASQQLISHHLRTLEKFGLVEREKVGMRYRYQLTREAIFLVNSTEFSVETD